MDFSKLNQNQKITLGLGGAALILSFLPWYSVSFGGFSSSINAWSAGFFAWAGVLLVVAGTVIVGLKALEVQDVKVGNLAAEQFGLILAAVGTLFIVLRFATQSSLSSFGLYLSIVVGAAATFYLYRCTTEAGLSVPGLAKLGGGGDDAS